MTKVLATRKLFLSGEENPKVEVRIFEPIKASDGFFECNYEFYFFESGDSKSGKCIGNDSVQAIIEAIKNIGMDLPGINENKFNGLLRRYSSEKEPEFLNFGFPEYKDGGFVFE